VLISTRLRWIAGLALVFALLFATNLTDRASFRGMDESVHTIYEDRLIAKGLVYDMRSILATKQVAIANRDDAYRMDGFRADGEEMRDLIVSFAGTKLTPEERRELEDLQRRYTALERLEEEMASVEGALSKEQALQLRTAHDAVIDDLYALSRTQLTEGRRARQVASRALRTVDVMTKIEVGLLAVLGLMLGALIMYWPREDDAPSDHDES